MKLTLSIIKADIGSIGGHIAPSRLLLDTVKQYVAQHGAHIIIDHYISHTGDDIAILMSRGRGVGDEATHRLAWEAFEKGTAVAKKQGLYGAGQDLLKDAFSGNVKGMGPAVAEMEFQDRPGEPFLMFAADKTDPGCFNRRDPCAVRDRAFRRGRYARIAPDAADAGAAQHRDELFRWPAVGQLRRGKLSEQRRNAGHDPACSVRRFSRTEFLRP